ncbi:MAG: ECF-type riboflavin transporter substrate-binding protein [Erysipelotrichaceae bacterium]
MKKTLLQQFIGEWNTKTIVGVAIGAALFGVLMVYGGVKIFTNTSLSTALLIPVIVGALFGPLPAFVACFLGNVLADTLGAWGYWWDWSIGNGVLGLLIGLLPLYGARIALGKFTIKHAVIYSLIAIFGNILAFGVITPIFTVLFYGGELTITLFQAQVAAYANAGVLIFLGLPLLYALALRNKSSQNLTKE